MSLLGPVDWLRSDNSDGGFGSVSSRSSSFMSALTKIAELEVLFLSPDLVILFANEAAARSTGISAIDLIGRGIEHSLM